MTIKFTKRYSNATLTVEDGNTKMEEDISEYKRGEPYIDENGKENYRPIYFIPENYLSDFIQIAYDVHNFNMSPNWQNEGSFLKVVMKELGVSKEDVWKYLEEEND